MLKQLIQNQKTYHELRAEWQDFQDFDPDVFTAVMELSKEVVAHLEELTQVVAIQPMTGPKGEVSLLRYKKSETGSQSLNVVKQLIEARASRLSARLEDSNAAKEIAEELITRVLGTVLRIAGKNDKLVLNNTKSEFSTKLHVGINKLANNIALTTRRGAGNFVIANTETVKLLADSKYFLPLPEELAVGVEHWLIKAVGSLNGKTTRVYSTHLMPADTFLIGYKGIQTLDDGKPHELARNMDSGLVYCPYIPVLINGKIENKTALMTREALVALQDEDGGSYNTTAAYYRLLEVA